MYTAAGFPKNVCADSNHLLSSIKTIYVHYIHPYFLNKNQWNLQYLSNIQISTLNTLQKNNIVIAPKNGGFQSRNLLFQNAPIFRGELFVSGRVHLHPTCNFQKKLQSSKHNCEFPSLQLVENPGTEFPQRPRLAPLRMSHPPGVFKYGWKIWEDMYMMNMLFFLLGAA